MSTPKKVLITGINGFVGSHLAEECQSRGWEVHGTIRSSRSDLKHIAGKNFILHDCDLSDYVCTERVIKDIKPDYLFHLAAQSYVPASWKAPRQTMEANIIGSMNIFEAVAKHSPKTMIQVAGSSEEYGLVFPHECPMTENQPLRPQSPYGVSKVCMDFMARQYVASYSLFIVITRAFNHTGPRRGECFAESQWAKVIADAEARKETPVIKHGNLDAIRDYTDVRDIVKGYILAIEKGITGEVYNLCSGPESSKTMRQIITRLASMSVSEMCEGERVILQHDPERMRPSDVPVLIGSAEKAANELCWKPEFTLEQTLYDLLNYWRAEANKK